MTHALFLAAAVAAGLLALSLALTAYWLHSARRHSAPDYGLHVINRGMRTNG